MFRRLFWLSTIAGVGYLVWRWVRQQGEDSAGPHSSGQLYTPPPPPTAAPTTLGGATVAPSATPRRIPTRVHRGAPPTSTLRDPDATSETDPQSAQPAPSDAPDLSDSAALNLAELVGHQTEAADDLAALVGDAAAGEAPADLAPPVTPADPATATMLGGELVNINTADEATLVALPGIGPALARRIIAHRDANGPFATVEELEVIQGIGPRNIEEFRHLVTA